MKPTDPTVQRLQGYLKRVIKYYPRAWEQLAKFRNEKENLDGWPDWCYLPMSAAHAIATGGRNDVIPMVVDTMTICGLGIWRMTQGVYRFNPDLFEALWTTPITRIPVDLLFRLPQWCVYIEAPGKSLFNLDLFGVFVWFEYDAETGRAELRALIDSCQELLPIIFFITRATLDECITATIEEAQKLINRQKLNVSSEMLAEEIRFLKSIIPPIISLALYLCSDEPDIEDAKGQPGIPPRPARHKKSGAFVPASAPAEWIIGRNLSAHLRQAREYNGGEHASVRAHIRRAHWHSYWVGPRDVQQLSLKWLPPTLIGIGDLPISIKCV
jgi:hypothetical protein